MADRVQIKIDDAILKLQRIKNLTKNTLDKYDKYLWDVKFNRSTAFGGICDHNKLNIEISWLSVLANNQKANLEIINHEVAHAIVGYYEHHNDVWKTKAIELGCSGERLLQAGNQWNSKFVDWCFDCNTLVLNSFKENFCSCGKEYQRISKNREMEILKINNKK